MYFNLITSAKKGIMSPLSVCLSVYLKVVSGMAPKLVDDKLLPKDKWIKVWGHLTVH